ncbi:hypothetical protein [Endozoicomonas sp. SCSIO W0465]|uniref:hypothetical protein n=1 Tax=Endozoicomonas sp. SCSIO W0465 TaxID=2918516 RepID=UPI0020751851|nr:hypothetical protein [Endozoicomonas sp. SCSIO W0465]USE34648.1 hypothetical protein MJO57_21270 [Endozoicomonas sp. SCSIO W0465]
MERSVYQGVRGGVTLAPLDLRTGIVGSATPKFAKTLAWKYGAFTGWLIISEPPV